MKLLTNLIFEPKGKHDPALAYTIKDTVMSADGSKVYFALQDVPAGTALNNEDYWKLQIDLSGSKSAMDEALASFSDYAKIVGTRVKGETAKASGNPVTFLPDAGSLLQPVTVLEPKQAGSGDPYPAGGGRNKLVGTAVTQTVNGVTFTVNADMSIAVNGTATENALFQARTNVKLNAGQYIITKCNEDNNISMWFNANGSDYYADGAFELAADTSNGVVVLYVPAGVTVNSIIYPMIRLASDTDATYAPPSNIRPITGYDAVELNHAGKNLIGNWEQGGVNSSGEEFDTNTVIRSAATKVTGKNVYVTIPSGYGFFLNEYNNGVYVDRTYSSASRAVGLMNGTTHIRMLLTKNNGSSIVPSEAVGYQVEYGTVGTEVVPYTNTIHTVQIGQTVYGGRFDWLTGKGVIEWRGKKFDGTENWGIQTNAGGLVRFWLHDDNFDVGYNENIWNTKMCSHAKETLNASDTYGASNTFTIYAAKDIYINLGFNNLDDFKAFLAAQNAAGTPVQVAYKLTTPIEIQLTPHIISAACPEQNNTLYGDGRIDVEYVKPLHVSIEEHVAAAVAAAMNTEGE